MVQAKNLEQSVNQSGNILTRSKAGVINDKSCGQGWYSFSTAKKQLCHRNDNFRAEISRGLILYSKAKILGVESRDFSPAEKEITACELSKFTK